MKVLTTLGIICLKDVYDIVYKVAKIAYTVREDDTYEYSFWPNYGVIDMLPPTLFQGIPGLDLSMRKECYVRANTVPVFISERTPGENRQDLWQLLEAQNMTYLNRLEWLIKTDSVYSGDLLYVKAYEPSDERQTYYIEDMKQLGIRAAQMNHSILKIICYGNDLATKTFRIDDTTRGVFYPLLMALFEQERAFIEERKAIGIQKALTNGRYKGRKPIAIDDTKLNEVLTAYQVGRISGADAMAKLNISKSTFYRRLKQWAGK